MGIILNCLHYCACTHTLHTHTHTHTHTDAHTHTHTYFVRCVLVVHMCRVVFWPFILTRRHRRHSQATHAASTRYELLAFTPRAFVRPHDSGILINHFTSIEAWRIHVCKHIERIQRIPLLPHTSFWGRVTMITAPRCPRIHEVVSMTHVSKKCYQITLHFLEFIIFRPRSKARMAHKRPWGKARE